MNVVEWVVVANHSRCKVIDPAQQPICYFICCVEGFLVLLSFGMEEEHIHTHTNTHTRCLFKHLCHRLIVASGMLACNYACAGLDIDWSFMKGIRLAWGGDVAGLILGYSHFCGIWGADCICRASQIHASWPSLRCHSQCGSFQTSCPHPSRWNRNLEFHLFPYLRLMWGWWCPGWKYVIFQSTHPQMDLYAGSTRSYFHRQDLCFLTPGNYLAEGHPPL